jgi:egghead protein (zeste-white 4 protein)
MLQSLKYPAILCWAMYAFWVIVGLFGLNYKQKKTSKKIKDIELVIVSIANKGVRNSLFECIVHHLKYFPDKTVYLLVDEGAELIDEITKSDDILSLTRLPDISFLNNQKQGQKKHQQADKTMVKWLKTRFSIVTVPSSYRKDLVGKGRAINYFIDTKVQDHKWYSLIDDDNLILDDTFLYEIPYYEKKGYSMTNPTITPRLGKSRFCYIMDFIRRYDDITLSRLFTGHFKSPLLGAHGEMLTVKGKVLKDIGFDFHTITEDFRFGIEFVKRKNKAWQSSTIVSVKSANNISDLFKQRGRWYKGIAKEIPKAPHLMRIIVSSRLMLWTIGIAGSWALFPLWFIWDMLWASVFLIGGITPWLVFIYYIRKKRQPLYLVILIPFFGIVESISFFAGLKHKKFVVIDKN